MTWIVFLLILAAVPSIVLGVSLLIFIWLDTLFPNPDTQEKVFETMILVNCVVWAPTIYRWGSQIVAWAGSLGA